jgi:hypothetical protein
VYSDKIITENQWQPNQSPDAQVGKELSQDRWKIASLHAYSGGKPTSLAQFVSFQKKDLITLSSNPELPVWRVEVRRIRD